MMNVLILKILALTSMIIDHYGSIFHGDILLYRAVGRIAFPIYCFLLVEGYTHTSNIKRYIKRLLIFALLSEIPFDLAFYGRLELSHQNIFFTLSIGLIAMYLLDNKEGRFVFNKTAIYLGACALAMFLFVDYSFIGIIYILQFHKVKDLPNPQKFYKLALVIFLVNLITFGWPQQFSLLALPIIYFYNGELGPKNKISQTFFYAAYPLHLIIFYIITMM